MSVITKMTTARSRDKKINIYLDGKYAFSLPAKDVSRAGLRAQQELSAEQITELAAADKYRRCYYAACSFVSYRPRSEYEVRQKLRQRRFDTPDIEKAISSLKDQGLINDVAFARFWKENRQDCSPRSRWLTGMELRQKGIDEALITRTVEDVDDKHNAYLAAVNKARGTLPDDYQAFRRKLGDFLKRRGFNYEVIDATVTRIWKEHGQKQDN
jgi:regulatory protein